MQVRRGAAARSARSARLFHSTRIPVCRGRRAPGDSAVTGAASACWSTLMADGGGHRGHILVAPACASPAWLHVVVPMPTTAFPDGLWACRARTRCQCKAGRVPGAQRGGRARRRTRMKKEDPPQTGADSNCGLREPARPRGGRAAKGGGKCGPNEHDQQSGDEIFLYKGPSRRTLKLW